VYALAPDGPRRGAILASGPVAPDGAFDLVLSEVPEGSGHLVVSVVVPGWITTWQVADVAPRIDLEIPLAERAKGDGAHVESGRILDATGRPVAGLVVTVAASPFDGCVPLSVLDERTAAVLHPIVDGGGLRGSAITDSDGRFQVAGIRCGGCARVYSNDPRWFVAWDEAGRNIARKAPLTLRPSARIEASVVSAATGQAVGTFDARGAVRGGPPWEARGHDGKLDVIYAAATEGPPGALDLTVGADGHWPTTISTDASLSGAPPKPLLLSLEPRSAANTGLLRVRIEGDGAEALAGDWIRMRLRRRFHSSVAVASLVSRETPFSVPTGAWDVEIVPESVVPALVRFVGSVVVIAGETTDVVWTVPALGAIRVDAGAFGVGRAERFAVLRGAGPEAGARGELEPSMRVPIGTWALDVVDGDGRVLSTHDVHVVRGEESLVSPPGR
jgi:protocatechuate 3,4-dioxygenase beta subunit